MRSRREQIEVFNVSLLDVLANALGGMLILLLLTMNRSAQQSTAAEARQTALQSQVNTATQQLDQAVKALDQAERDRSKLAEAQEMVRQTQATLIGLKGDFKRIVFLFDTSGSMNTPGFDVYKEFLKGWILTLPFEKFDVVQFNTGVRAWNGSSLQPATEDNRRAAADFIDTFVADGGTNTLEAFEQAFRYPDVDAIVLFSDGAPTKIVNGQGVMQNGAVLYNFDEVLDYLDSQNASRRVRINCIGMGNYFDNVEGWGKFLHDVAERHGGVFIGR